jgi:hypothetical protein
MCNFYLKKPAIVAGAFYLAGIAFVTASVKVFHFLPR